MNRDRSIGNAGTTKTRSTGLRGALGNLWPRRTVRFRLTAIYGALFFASGAAVLTVINILVRRDTSGVVYSTSVKDGQKVVSLGLTGGAPPTTVHAGAVRLGGSSSGGFITKHLNPVLHGSGGVATGPVSTTPVFTNGLGGKIPVPSNLPRRDFLAQARQLTQAAINTRSTEIHDLLLLSIGALIIIGVVGIVIGWFVAGRMLSPLRTMTSAVKDISATNLHRRLALRGPDDELKDLGRTFDDLLGRLEQSFRAQRQFVANASHELRTPLARQKALAQIALADRHATVASLRAAHERVLASGEQQERLIEALLSLARGQAGVEERESIDQATVCEEVLLGREAEAASIGVTLTRDLAPTPIMGDRRLVERLVSNLIDNALHYNAKRGEVSVRTGVQGDSAVITIENTGPLVPMTAIERLRRPFQRLDTERSGSGAGCGLGLSIVQAIADAHEATLEIRPRTGGGLVVEVSFLLDQANPSPVTEATQQAELTTQPVPSLLS